MQPNGAQGSFQQPNDYQQSMLQHQMSPQLSPGISPTQQFGSPVQSPPFQPSSFFGQQLASGQLSSSYGYLQGQNTSPQTYNPVQQQLQSPGYIPQFDPYASIGQGWDDSFQSQQSNQQAVSGATSATSAAPTTSTTSYNGHVHPREYLRTHKQEVESWDSYAWKQLLNCFDALKDAWGARKKELEGQVAQLQMQFQYGGGGYYGPQIQQEGARLQGLMKEAESHSDSVAASSFQMHEVFSSYRQSGDLASKRRVRESSNAALQALPDWPPQQY